MSSMETISPQATWNWTVPAAALIAPVAWGSTYVVTENWLPPDRPLFAAAMRALPIGLIIVALKRELPHGIWWWRSLVLGTLNIGLFFALIFTAAYRLPGGLASTVTAMSPLAVMLLAAFIIRERPTAIGIGGALVGAAGVALLVLRAGVHVDLIGLLAAVGAVLVSGVGFVLVKRWERPADLLTVTGWQLAAGGLVLVPATLIFEGGPPAVDLPAAVSFVYLGIIGTGLAYFVWFRGLTRMPAGSTSLLGLVNPIVGTAIGVVAMHETFGAVQAVGVVLVLGGVLAGQPAVVSVVRGWLRRHSRTHNQPALVECG
ncbi:MAG: putative blue pigment (indigoidine) exporter [Nocardioidaceae bacterium]|jgi:probable blue pigment (indigoidine) exporter|nr:putative blue pigment (indigoidine) exporter [Nocardioidaceae bacterium]